MTTVTAAAASSPAVLAGAPPMQALLQSAYGGTEVLSPGKTARPSAGAGEVLLRVQAAGVDRGTWHLMTGRPYLMRLMGFGFRKPLNPVPGLDVCGTVVEVGPGVTRFQTGDVVFGFAQGSFAEYARASADKLARIPKGMEPVQAAVLAVSGVTALQALTDAGQVKHGERVLIIGASGGVGTYAVQLAKALGARVTAVCSAAKAGLMRELGADHVLDYRQDDFTRGDTTYDVILDIGGNTPLARLRRALTPTGRLVFVGGEHGGDWTAGFGRQLLAALVQPFVKQRFLMMMAREHFSSLEALAARFEGGEFRPVIDRTISLAEVPAAIADLEAGRVKGKVAVRMA